MTFYYFPLTNNKKKLKIIPIWPNCFVVSGIEGMY